MQTKFSASDAIAWWSVCTSASYFTGVDYLASPPLASLPSCSLLLVSHNIIRPPPPLNSCTPPLRAGHGGQSDACTFSLCDTRLTPHPFAKTVLITNLASCRYFSWPMHHVYSALTYARAVARSVSTAKDVRAPRPAHAQPVSDWISTVQ